MNELVLEAIDPLYLGVTIAVGLFVAIRLALAVGGFLGRRAIARSGASGVPPLGSLEGAVFALLGLLIAFTFSGAAERFDARRAQAVDEANAMGTAWLRLDLVPPAAQPAMRETMRGYVDARIATYRAIPDLGAVQRQVARANELQNRLWGQAVAAVRSPEIKGAAEQLLLPALNEMFDLASTRIAARLIHPPVVIYVLLVALAIAAALLSGYQSAGEAGYGWLHRSGFALIVALTVYLIIDLEFPRLGFVRVDAIDRLLVDVRAGMN